ncbi:MAG: hypothetical protein JRG83_19775 [Deltaproteobacteria bacterium]|nr:hypothetical protein [Deltaproteobacteria bacterium]
MRGPIRERPGRVAGAAAVFCLALLSIGVVLTGPALGQTASDVRPDFDAAVWLGCWEDWEEDGDSEPIFSRKQIVCLEPGLAPRALIRRSIVDGVVVSVQTLWIDGSRLALKEGGCEGWNRAQPSQEGARLYLRAEVVCDPGRRRHVSGAWMLLSRERWLEIQVVRVEGVVEVTVEHRRAVSASTLGRPGAIPLAIETGRLAATAPLEVEDVLEALAHVDPEVVEVMLFETRPSFPMRSSLLIELANSGVPEQIIDLMVALSFPDRFVIADNTIRLAPAPVVGVPYDYWYSPYGYFYPYHHYGYWYPHPPVHRPKGGRVINGYGYTRVHRSRRPSSSSGSSTEGAAVSAGSGGGSGGGTKGSVSPSGYSRSSNSKR